MRLKIWHKVTLSFLLVGVIFIVTTGSIYYHVAKNQLQQEIFSRLSSVAQLKKQFIERFFRGNIENIKSLQISLGSKHNLLVLEKYKNDRTNPAYLEAMQFIEGRYEEYTNIYEEVDRLMLVDTTGEVVFMSPLEEQSHLGKLLDEAIPAKESVFEKAKKGIYRTDIMYHPDHGDYMMTLVAPLFLEERFIGEIAIEINPDGISKIMGERAGLSDSGETYLVGEDFLARSPLRFEEVPSILKTKVDTEGTRIWYEEHIIGDKPADMPEGLISIYPNYRGDKVWGLHYHIHGVNWAMILEINISEALAPLKVIRNYFIIISCFISILGVFVGFFLFRGVMQSISKLNKGTKIIGAGNLGYKIEIKSKDEIGELAASFNEMSSDLQKYHEKVRMQNVELEERVEERTSELEKAKQDLEEKLIDLERFNKIAVGRELRMIELKEKIKELEEKIGE